MTRRGSSPTSTSARSWAAEAPADAEAGSLLRPHPHDGAVRAVVLRAAAVPVDLLRRRDPAQAQGLPNSRSPSPRPRSSASRPTCAWPACGWARCATRSSTPTGTARSPRSSSIPSSPRVRKNAKAILRQKTLLGETYVELTPGTPGSPTIPEGGTLSNARVTPTVELDEIFTVFDPQTREAFKAWQQDLDASYHRARPGPLRQLRKPSDLRHRRHRAAEDIRRGGRRPCSAWSATPAACSPR